ncbi:15002_t:CDS:2 [Dentiscutata erythropus]|uniref:mitogen-activated protein kinase kinase n=1 Tax=Dentiscutata erythropus TaxID=1348616 RepID=A0A9N8WCB9_9GLOM|nr:15002_t:CDS:2 [Dentiscutata erythropus]
MNDLIEECLNKENIKIYEYSCFKDVRFIGEGAYGKVQRATLKSDGVIVALKSFKNIVDNEEIVKEHSNNILVHQKCIKLSDFGLSKRLDEATNSKQKCCGVFAYMDPQSFNFLSTNDEQTMSRIGPYTQQIRQVPLSLQDSSTNGEQVINRIGPDIQHAHQVPINTNGEQTINRNIVTSHRITTLISRKNGASGKCMSDWCAAMAVEIRFSEEIHHILVNAGYFKD